MNAVRATDAQHVFELERATTARLAQLLDVGEDDVDRLGDLIGKRGVPEIRRRHTIVDPATRLLLPIGNVGVDVARHARGEGDDVVMGDLLDLVDLRDGEAGMVANPTRLLLRNAGLTQLSLRLAGEHLYFLPYFELVLKLPDTPPSRDACND